MDDGDGDGDGVDDDEALSQGVGEEEDEDDEDSTMTIATLRQATRPASVSQKGPFCACRYRSQFNYSAASLQSAFKRSDSPTHARRSAFYPKTRYPKTYS